MNKKYSPSTLTAYNAIKALSLSMVCPSLALGAANYVFKMEKEEQTTLQNIAGIVKWYQGIGKGFNDIELLQNAVRKLATYIFMFADELGEFYQARNETEFPGRPKPTVR